MGFWKDYLGIAPPSPPPTIPIAEATLRERTHSEKHRDRFARAFTQTEVALKNGETTAERLAELKRWYEYYSGLAAAEAAKPQGADDVAAEEGEV